MNQKQLIELLKSGDFTIMYWDNGEASVYKGKWNYNKEFKKDEYKMMNKSLVYETNDEIGYLPKIVDLLVKSLGGRADTI